MVVLGAQALSGALACRLARPLAHAAAGLEDLAPLACGESRLAEWLWPTERCGTEPLPLADLLLLGEDPGPLLSELPEPALGQPPPRAARAAGAGRARPSGLLIRASRVRAAARRGVRPGGSPVSRTEERPAGLALHGVTALGMGLYDGDVLTRAAGAAATSPEAVIQAVTAAVHRGDPVVTGEVWRNGHRLVVTVEIPGRKLRRQRRAGGGTG